MQDIPQHSADRIDTNLLSQLPERLHMEDEFLKLYYTAEMAKLAYQVTEDRRVELDRLGTDEHICVCVYLATG